MDDVLIDNYASVARYRDCSLSDRGMAAKTLIIFFNEQKYHGVSEYVHV